MVSTIEMTGDGFVGISVPYEAEMFNKPVRKTTASFTNCKVCSIVPPQTSFIAFSVVNPTNTTIVKLVIVFPTCRFAEHLCSVRNKDVDNPVSSLFNRTNHSIFDVEVCPILPISGGNDSRKRQEKRHTFKH